MEAEHASNPYTRSFLYLEMAKYRHDGESQAAMLQKALDCIHEAEAYEQQILTGKSVSARG